MKVIILLLLLSIFYYRIASQYLCIPKCVCLQSEGFMSCHENADVRMIPIYIDKSITRFIVQKGNFDNPYLDRHNLTGLEHLTFLKIIYYNLRTIASRTFIDMKMLQYLDLSHNKLILVSSFAFRGLGLQELHIMGNVNVNFQEHSFYDMTSLTINMRSNNLSGIDYSMFKNTKVKYFYLYNNRITTIDSDFQLLFNDSDSLLDLSNNPLTCDCSMNWLAEILTVQYSKKNSLIHLKSINIICFKPEILRNKQLRLLKAKDLQCLPLKIEAIKLHFENDSAKLTCISKVGGHKSSTVKWLHYINEFENNFIKGSSIIEFSERNIVSSHARTYNTINLTGNAFNNGIIKLICLASISDNIIQKLEIHIHKSIPSPIQYLSNQTISKFQIPKEKHFLFVKHFSILEMLGAILGTFSATFGGLLIILRSLRSYQNKLINSKDFLDLHKTLNSVKPYWYIPHGDSSTYSVPNSHPEYEIPTTFDNIQNGSNVYPSYILNKLEFFDYKTQNLIVS